MIQGDKKMTNIIKIEYQERTYTYDSRFGLLRTTTEDGTRLIKLDIAERYLMNYAILKKSDRLIGFNMQDLEYKLYAREHKKNG